MMAQGESPQWWQECFAADGKVDFVAAVKFWAERLRTEPAGEERMRYRDRVMHVVADGVEKANGLDDLLDAYHAASLILTHAWTLAASGDTAATERRMPTVKRLAEVMQDVFAAAENPAQGITTGFPRLDDYLCGGPEPGQLVYVGARPGVGKSAFALEVARAAAESGRRVLIVSREMLATALGRRMLAQYGRISAKDIRRGAPSVWPAATKAAQHLATLPIHISDDALSVDELGWLCSAAMLNPPDLLIVDYLQIMAAPAGTPNEKRHQVEAISAALKAFALRRKIPVICLSSLSRTGNAEDGKEKPPTMNNFRESAQIEHDADIAILLHRHRGESQCDCIVAKNRDGETGVIELYFSAESVSFAEASQRTEDAHFYAGRHDREE